MTTYQGHKNWNHWNVSLWINNDEGLYCQACDMVKRYGRRRAAKLMAEDFAGMKTPDGASYSESAIYAALEGM